MTFHQYGVRRRHPTCQGEGLAFRRHCQEVPSQTDYVVSLNGHNVLTLSHEGGE